MQDELSDRRREMASGVNVMIGGEAGQGVQSVGAILAKAFAREDTISSPTKITSLE